MNDTDRARILWAIRVAQAVLYGQDLCARINEATDTILGGEDPDNEDLDDLCERLNCGDVEPRAAI